MKMQSLWEYNVFNGQTSLFGKIKLKGCVFRQQFPVTLYYKANCYSHQTNLENERLRSPRIVDTTLALTVQVYGLYSQLQTLRDTHVLHSYVSGRKKKKTSS